MSLVSTQPPCAGRMDLYNLTAGDEKHTQCEHDHKFLSPSACECVEVTTSHRSCHKSRLRRLAVPVLLSLLTVGAMLLLSCLAEVDIFDFIGVGDAGILSKRQTTSSSGSTFTNKKLYLIIIFVGLLLVVIAAIMLSFCCCKGAFQNPLCCPCYLCACCGGLACLECIGCGLCAAGLDEAL
ncbi:hypothetical protein BJ138DRAFT_1162312 [Hygrophoropsis aurantiaca]|uniref:Uncharacterized protein n=1 Tax=Hygrophoropsis aurantiaca TaxID=72124 RepID=A0ACB8A0A8_9AGAM|nr:hypothetical protein BJ138DRAFT_1162312 [Hygrophoropsis aurantiaca]